MGTSHEHEEPILTDGQFINPEKTKSRETDKEHEHGNVNAPNRETCRLREHSFYSVELD